MKKHKGIILPVLTLLGAFLIYIIDREKGIKVALCFFDTCKSTIPILLLMFLLLSFVKFIMDTSKIEKYFKKQNNIRNMIFAYLFGTLVSGPIYPGFALGKMLINGGVKIRIIIAMISVWATLKIPLLPYEIQILGLKLCVIRWLVTGIAILVLALLCEKICILIEKKSKNDYKVEQKGN